MKTEQLTQELSCKLLTFCPTSEEAMCVIEDMLVAMFIASGMPGAAMHESLDLLTARVVERVAP